MSQQMADESLYHEEYPTAKEAHQDADEASHNSTENAVLRNQGADNDAKEQTDSDRGKLKHIVQPSDVYARGNVANNVVDFTPGWAAVGRCRNDHGVSTLWA
jgi:hypothetical protein